MYNSKLYWALSYLTSVVIACISISVCSSLVGISIGITISAIRLKICAIAAAVKKYKSIIKKKKKKHNKKVLLTKFKFNSIKGLISKTLIKSRITRDEFVLINNQLKECNDMNEEKKLKT